MTSARDQQIRAIYQAALERPRRRARVVRRAARRRAITSCASPSSACWRSRTRPTSARHAVTSISDEAPELAAGTHLGHYRIDGVLGRGGMGVVYRATDTKLQRAGRDQVLVDCRRRRGSEAAVPARGADRLRLESPAHRHGVRRRRARRPAVHRERARGRRHARRAGPRRRGGAAGGRASSS